MNVYLNNVILTRDLDYVWPQMVLELQYVSASLSLGDVLTMQEYSATYGSFVPNTPTKLGLYPAYRPEIVVQKTSNGTQTVIIGHDGSVTEHLVTSEMMCCWSLKQEFSTILKLDGNPVPINSH
jgi:hypothetical protein